jgi:hypothetical protein
VVVAVTTGKSCKFSLNEWLPTIDTLRMDVWCCFEWMYSIPHGANGNSWAFPLKFPLHMGYHAPLWVTNDCLLVVKSLILCNFSVLWMPISNLGLLFCSRSPPQRYRSRSPDYRPYNGR